MLQWCLQLYNSYSKLLIHAYLSEYLNTRGPSSGEKHGCLAYFSCKARGISSCHRLTCTSSSLRIGMDRTLYFCRSSLDRGADMSRRLMWEGAVKCLFLFFLREEDTNGLHFILADSATKNKRVRCDNPIFLFRYFHVTDAINREYHTA